MRVHSLWILVDVFANYLLHSEMKAFNILQTQFVDGVAQDCVSSVKMFYLEIKRQPGSTLSPDWMGVSVLRPKP
jgi:hypothetical protein